MLLHDANLNEPHITWGFSKSKKFFPIIGWLISAFQKNLASHTFVRVTIPSLGLVVVIDATSHTVRVRPWEDFLKENRMVKAYGAQITADKAMQILVWGISKSGEKYPMLEIAGNLIQQIVRILSFEKLEIRNPFGQGKLRPRCNELSLLAFKDLFGMYVPPDLDSLDLLYLDDYIKQVPWLQPVVD